MDNRTEIFDEKALRLNINRIKERLSSNEEMNLLTFWALEASIEHLEEGLKLLLCRRV